MNIYNLLCICQTVSIHGWLYFSIVNDVSFVIAVEYCHTSNISRTFVGNKMVDHSDVVGASPFGAAPTTSSFSTSIYCTKTTARWDWETYKFYDLVHLILGVWWYIDFATSWMPVFSGYQSIYCCVMFTQQLCTPEIYHIVILHCIAFEMNTVVTDSSGLTHWGHDEMAAIFQMTFSNAFSSMKMYEFRLKVH